MSETYKHLTPDEVAALLERLPEGPLRRKILSAWDRNVPLHLSAAEGAELVGEVR